MNDKISIYSSHYLKIVTPIFQIEFIIKYFVYAKSIVSSNNAPIKFRHEW